MLFAMAHAKEQLDTPETLEVWYQPFGPLLAYVIATYTMPYHIEGLRCVKVDNALPIR